MATTAEQMVQRAANPTVGALDGFGGFLRCETCGHGEALGDPGRRVTGDGWPKHCGYTMRWWTQRQIAGGEVPRVAPQGPAA